MKQCRKCKQFKDLKEFNKNQKWCKLCQQKYYEKNKEKILKKRYEVRKIYRKQYPKVTKKYYESHKEQYLEYARIRRKNPKYRLNDSISEGIRKSLKNGKNGLHWEFYVDYTQKDLMRHLEKQFTEEMSWKNYGSYWHIDHIVPISVFNYDSIDHLDFKRCWALDNLRPLEKHRNLVKNNKINGSFQPNLKI